MLIRAGIQFSVDAGEGWHKRIILAGDRCFVFRTDGSLCGVRNLNDTESFDKD